MDILREKLKLFGLNDAEINQIISDMRISTIWNILLLDKIQNLGWNISYNHAHNCVSFTYKDCILRAQVDGNNILYHTLEKSLVTNITKGDDVVCLVNF